MSALPEATPRQAHQAVAAGGALLVDVREVWEYEERHIPGSHLLPLAELPARIAELPADCDLYVHCRLGSRSARAVEYLLETGRPRAFNLLGGIDAWVEEGLPTE